MCFEMEMGEIQDKESLEWGEEEGLRLTATFHPRKNEPFWVFENIFQHSSTIR